jgi:hypothetical protein
MESRARILIHSFTSKRSRVESLVWLNHGDPVIFPQRDLISKDPFGQTRFINTGDISHYRQILHFPLPASVELKSRID